MAPLMVGSKGRGAPPPPPLPTIVVDMGGGQHDPSGAAGSDTGASPMGIPMALHPEQYPYTDYLNRKHPVEEDPIFESIKDLHTDIPDDEVEPFIQAILAQPEGQQGQFCYDLVTIVKQLTETNLLKRQTALYHAGRRIVDTNEPKAAKKDKGDLSTSRIYETEKS